MDKELEEELPDEFEKVGIQVAGGTFGMRANVPGQPDCIGVWQRRHAAKDPPTVAVFLKPDGTIQIQVHPGYIFVIPNQEIAPVDNATGTRSS